MYQPRRLAQEQTEHWQDHSLQAKDSGRLVQGEVRHPNQSRKGQQEVNNHHNKGQDVPAKEKKKKNPKQVEEGRLVQAALHKTPIPTPMRRKSSRLCAIPQHHGKTVA